MDLCADVRVPFPRELVFAAYRDDMARLLPYLSNVRGIEVKSRKDEGPIAEIVNDWQGGGEIPVALRAVLGDSVLGWTDHARWDALALRCHWRTETRAFADAMQCSGCNAFLEDGAEGTLLEVRGALGIDARKIRGVPGFLAGKVGRVAEEFLVAKVQSNLVDTAQGLARYLGDRARRA